MKGERINGTAILEAAIRACGSTGYEYVENGTRKEVWCLGFGVVYDESDGSCRFTYDNRGVTIQWDGMVQWDEYVDRLMVGSLLAHTLAELSRMVNGPSIDTSRLSDHERRTLIDKGVILVNKG